MDLFGSFALALAFVCAIYAVAAGIAAIATRHPLLIIALVLASFAATIAAASAVTGVVRNGTTGAPVAGADVVLIQLQGGMEVVANTKTQLRLLAYVERTNYTTMTSRPGMHV